MSCLQFFPRGSKYEQAPPTLRPQVKRKTICSRIRYVFRGLPKPAPPHAQYRDEKKYKHVPTHSASSFTKTTTTAAMVSAVIEPEPTRKEGLTESQLLHIDQSLGDQPTTTTGQVQARTLDFDRQEHHKQTEEDLIHFHDVDEYRATNNEPPLEKRNA